MEKIRAEVDLFIEGVQGVELCGLGKLANILEG
jgi:hypothetical protein